MSFSSGPGPEETLGEGGFVAGAETLVFSVLIFVFGTLVVVNAWAIIDARFAAAAAAREAVRAAVAAPVGADLAEVSLTAARGAFAGFGRDPMALELRPLASNEQVRCGEIAWEVATVIRPVAVSFIGSLEVEVSSRSHGFVDPYRSGLGGERHCDA